MRIYLIVLCLTIFSQCKRVRVHPPAPTTAAHNTKADSILNFAQSLLNKPYKPTGVSPSGFDCSGYTMYVFNHFNIALPHSSSEQMKIGTNIDLCQAAKGDIVVFTGTDKSIREPGHVGIVLQNDTCLVTFIHASSNGGVKISTIEKSYKERFLSVRRLSY